MRKKISYISVFFSLLVMLTSVNVAAVQFLDGIVAVVEDDVILESELMAQTSVIAMQLKAGNVELPPENILYRQVLDRLIIEKLQSQLAEKAGVNVTDQIVDASLARIAQQNGLDMQGFKAELANQGMDYQAFRENMRKEIVINQIRNQQIGARVRVSDQEVKHYMQTEISSADQKIEYLLSHILIAVSEGEAADIIQAATTEAQEVTQQLRAGAEFKTMAVSVSDGEGALQGGNLGWRTLNQMPTLFVDVVKAMNVGDIADPIRSPGGFHILKLMDSKGVQSHMVTETHARHILIKTTELISDTEAKIRLEAVAGRIADGDDFAALAKANSDDTGSAIKGGDLGWVAPGLLVPPFEKAMNKLALGEISAPVQTQFGWHLIQVLERRSKDNREEEKVNQARNEIRKRKIEEETELWLRRLRDEAYVDIRLGAQ
ncbi:MAG: molecular chaperone SurA [Methyloprofundus sp.]|nr:molecular chaperone SurA [Methyloprofundus sp.]